MTAFVPTFEPPPPQQQNEIIVEYDKDPTMKTYSSGSDYLFIFIVDRSGSMQIKNRLDITKNALKLFLRSLPCDCKFSIISFGTSY